MCTCWLQSSEAEVESGAPPIMPDVDAYLVLYSVADNKSFQSAETKLSSLNKDLKRETAVILVANKSDIVRNRTVTADGKQLSLIHTLTFASVFSSNFNNGSMATKMIFTLNVSVSRTEHQRSKEIADAYATCDRSLNICYN